MQALSRAKGKTIESITFSQTSADRYENKMVITFDNGDALAVYDDGQQCCERRYMVANEDMSFYPGAEFYDLDVRDAVISTLSDGDILELQFMIVSTSFGSFTASVGCPISRPGAWSAHTRAMTGTCC